MEETPRAVVTAESRVYEEEEVVDDRGNTVTSPSIRGMDTMMPIMQEVTRDE